MTDPRLEHLDPATIAALVDRTLAPAARAAAEAHLAACADCREVWVETSEMAEEMSEAASRDAVSAPVPVVAHRPRSRRLMYGGMGLAAALVIGVGAWLTLRVSEREAALMALQADTATYRFTAGRLSAPFPYRPHAGVQRGEAATQPPASVVRSALRLQELAEAGDGAALHAAGLAHLATGDPDRAVEILSRASSTMPDDASLHSDLAAALLERWHASGETTDAARALDEAKRATLLDPDAPAPRFNLALAFDALGLASQTKTAFEAYLRLDSSSPWAEEARQRLGRLGAEHEADTGSYSPLYYALESQWLPAWAAALGSGQPAPSRELRRASERLGRNGDGAVVSILRAALEGSDVSARARTCVAAAASAIGEWTAAFEAGRSEDALASARRARAQLRCAGLPETDAASREATSLLELNRLAEADALASTALTNPGTPVSHRARARALQVRGLVALQQARFSDAIEHTTRAVDAAGTGGDLEFKAALQTHLASLFSKQGDVRQAWRHLGGALHGEAATESVRRRYSIFGRAVISAIELGLPAAALAFAEALQERTEGWTNPVAHAVAHLKRAEVLTQLRFADEARGALSDADRLIPGVGSARVRSDLQAQADLTAGLLAHSPQDGIDRLDRAVAYFEHSDNRLLLAPSLLARGRLHKRASRLRRAEDDWQRGVALVEDQRPEIRDAQLQISRMDRVWELFEELIGLVAETRPDEALEIAERSRARQLLASLSRGQRAEPLRGRALHEWLPAGTDALVYSVLPDRLLIWHVTGQSVALSRVPISKAALEARITAFRDTLRRPGANVHGDPLETVVLPRAFRPRGTLLLIPDGPLHLLPFAALRDPDGALFGGTTTLVNGASLTTTAAAPAMARTPDARSLLVGVSLGDQEQGLPPLPGVRREIAALASLYGGASTLIDAQATPGAVLEALPAHSLVHFAGHAVTDSIYPNRSRLVLAGSAHLTSGQIAAAGIRPGTIVVLGACDTANGGIFRGEGALALSRAFLAAGAGSVIAALWKLDDDEGQRFLVAFHRRLTGSRSAPEALRDTQLEWIRSGGAPSVWASFQVIGALPQSRRE